MAGERSTRAAELRGESNARISVVTGQQVVVRREVKNYFTRSFNNIQDDSKISCAALPGSGEYSGARKYAARERAVG